MEEYLTELKPVSEWDFRLWKIVWSHPLTGRTKTMYLVCTEDHMPEEVQRRWPSDFYSEYMEYDIGKAPQPPKIGEIYGSRISQDGWSFGEDLARQRGLI